LIGLVHEVNSQSNHLLLFEKNISPIASSENILTIRESFFRFENKFLPNQLEGKSKLINVGYRLFKAGGINRFVDNAVKLFQHEFFGHGYRQREFGYTRNSVNLKLTLFGFSGFSRLGTPTPNRIFTFQERTMWFMGGLEATSILSETILSHWIRSQKISLNDTYLFLSSLRTGLLAATSHDDDLNSDVELYLRRINNHYGFFGIENYQLTLKKIRRHALVELLNPYVFFTLYAFSKDYLWNGKEKVNLPMINLGRVKYMPYFNFWLTPYGSEFQLNHILKTDKRIYRFHLRLGDDTFDNTSWGTGITIENLIQNNWIRFSPDINIWHQPSLELGGISTTEIKEEGFGGAIRLHASFKFITNQNLKKRTDLHINVGYKTKGYLQGEALSDNFILRFGFSLTY
ncbi:MAG: hypothetical protein AAF573_11920, partial [Bacteroidota bacterium]